MMASPMYLSSVPRCRNKMSVIAPRYSLSRRTSSSGLMPSESVVKSRMSLNMTVRSLTSPPGRMYFCGSFSISAMTPGERYCEKALANLPFLPLLEEHAEAGGRHIRADQRGRGNHEAEPASPVDKAEVHEPHEQPPERSRQWRWRPEGGSGRTRIPARRRRGQ